MRARLIRALDGESKVEMKIYDPENKLMLSSVTLFLTPEEAAELASDAQDLADHPEKQHHHVNSRDYEAEITVAVYTRGNIAQFDSESRHIIGDDIE
jgi:hypothetical protein